MQAKFDKDKDKKEASLIMEKQHHQIAILCLNILC